MQAMPARMRRAPRHQVGETRRLKTRKLSRAVKIKLAKFWAAERAAVEEARDAARALEKKSHIRELQATIKAKRAARATQGAQRGDSRCARDACRAGGRGRWVLSTASLARTEAAAAKNPPTDANTRLRYNRV